MTYKFAPILTIFHIVNKGANFIAKINKFNAGGGFYKMEYKDAKGDKEPLLRINTQKHKVVPLKNTKEANVFAISMGKKSKIKAKIKCDGCQALLNRTEMKKCYSCSKNICPDCSRKKQGKNYCSECL